MSKTYNDESGHRQTGGIKTKPFSSSNNIHDEEDEEEEPRTIEY